MTEWTWGIDVGASKIALAAVRPGEPAWVQALHVGAPPGARRLALLTEHVRELVRTFALVRPPLTVWVERPVGPMPVPSLDHAVGVVLAAVYAELDALFPHPTMVELIGTGEWKRGCGLPGNARKPAVMAWARSIGYAGADQDCADALGIATAGAATVARSLAA